MRLSLTLSSLLLATCIGSLPAWAAVFGDDNRIEARESGQPFRTYADEAVVAMLWDGDFTLGCDSDVAFVDRTTHGEFEMLCPGTRFENQLVPFQCSGVFVGGDVVLTATHCLVGSCEELFFAFGAYLREGEETEVSVSSEQVYACREVLLETGDISAIKLDRPPPAELAAPVFSDGLPLEGEDVAVMGFPGGLPMKFAGDCEIVGEPADLNLNCDVFGGNSGSPLFSATGELVGIVNNGVGDYRFDPVEACYDLMQLEEDGTIPGVPGAVPQFASAVPHAVIVEEACASGLSALCDRAALCGDGICSAGEADDCADDCPAPSCGDGVCSPLAESACSADCGDAAQCEVPPEPPDDGDESQGGCGGSGLFAVPLIFGLRVRRLRQLPATRRS